MRLAAVSKALVVGGLLALLPGVVSAAPHADTFSIVRAYGYGSVLENGDTLLLVQYHIDYNDPSPGIPSETASEAFFVHYNDVSEGEIRRSAAPFVFVRSGYGQGLAAVYMDSADTTGFSITYQDADEAIIGGNPAVFADPQDLRTLIEWRATSSQATLETDIRLIADSLEERSEWSGVDLIAGQLLQASGESYFEAVVVNLRTMAPAIFSGAIINPDFSERTFTTSTEAQLQRLFDNSRFEGMWTNLASWLSLPEMMVEFLFAATIAIIVWFFAWKMTGNQGVGLPVVAVVLLGSALLGWVQLQLIAILGFMAILSLAFVLFFKRA